MRKSIISRLDNTILQLIKQCLSAHLSGHGNVIIDNIHLSEQTRAQLRTEGIFSVFRPATIEESTISHTSMDRGTYFYSNPPSSNHWYRFTNDGDCQYVPNHQYIGKTILWW